MLGMAGFGALKGELPGRGARIKLHTVTVTGELWFSMRKTMKRMRNGGRRGVLKNSSSFETKKQNTFIAADQKLGVEIIEPRFVQLYRPDSGAS